MNEWIVFSYEEDESHLPIFLSLDHQLKKENVSSCSSQIIMKISTYIIKKLTNMDYIVILMFELDAETIHFVRGFLYINDNEYPILQYSKYASLQIGNSCYDNINCIQLPKLITNK